VLPRALGQRFELGLVAQVRARGAAASGAKEAK
jgi:hypothetical protein